MRPVISVEHISKTYQLGQIGTGTLANDLQVWWAKQRGRPNPLLPIGERDDGTREGETIWALRDLSFTVEQGEVVGIIGRNGAGKSTLLKIISRITAPTAGKVRLRGRVASLLEVGTGFHPELTGRENIYLNGAILGMRRHEISQTFDEIVDFAEVQEFIDTPVKRYSSGMYVRLAFAVAAHLDPEILVVDEVLAVGDAEFQKKCLGKMGNVARQGRTVLFVSHNMDSVEKLCARVLMLDEGVVKADDANVRAAIDLYLAHGAIHINGLWHNKGNEFDNEWFRPVKVSVCDAKGEVVNAPVSGGDELYLRIDGEVRALNRDLMIGYYCFSDRTNYPVYLSQFNDGPQTSWPKICLGTNALLARIPTGLLNEGSYRLKPYVILRSGLNTKVRYVNPDEDKLAVSFEISKVANESPSWLRRRGVIAPVVPWSKVDLFPSGERSAR